MNDPPNPRFRVGAGFYLLNAGWLLRQSPLILTDCLMANGRAGPRARAQAKTQTRETNQRMEQANRGNPTTTAAADAPRPQPPTHHDRSRPPQHSASNTDAHAPSDRRTDTPMTRPRPSPTARYTTYRSPVPDRFPFRSADTSDRPRRRQQPRP